MSAGWTEGQTIYPFCRVCLVSKVRMCPIENIELQEIYGKLINNQQYKQHAVPQAICYICYAQLRRCYRFSKMAHKSQMILEYMHQQGVEVHKREMPNFENAFKLSVSDISITSRPSTTNGNCRVVEDHAIVKEEIISEGDIKIEEVSSEQEENIFEIFIDPNQKYTKDEPIDESSSKKTKHVSTAIPKSQSINLHRKSSSPDCLKNKLISSLQSRKKNPSRKKTVSCTVCMKSFTCNSNLQSHMRTHTGEKPFVCKICNKSFSENSTLERHKVVHNPEKPFKCQMCSKTFSHSSTLQYHMSTHSGEEPYSCNTCSKGFTNKHSLQRHLIIHTREKLFVCNICDKRFLENGGLKKHMRTHTGEKPFKCNMCIKRFSVQNRLQNHMRTHTGEKPYVCNTCNKAFTYRNNLLSHIRTHTGEKPFVCHICSKRFCESGNLKKHVRTHTEDKRCLTSLLVTH